MLAMSAAHLRRLLEQGCREMAHMEWLMKEVTRARRNGSAKVDDN
jgi:hypothetical protein